MKCLSLSWLPTNKTRVFETDIGGSFNRTFTGLAAQTNKKMLCQIGVVGDVTAPLYETRTVNLVNMNLETCAI